MIFRNMVKAALPQYADKHGEITASYETLAGQLDASASDVHQALLQLKDAGHFRGKPYFDSERFNVCL